MFDAQQPNDRSVESSIPSETSDPKPAKPLPRRYTDVYPRLDVPALPDSPSSSEDEHSPATAVRHKDRQEALQRLKLTDRFAKPPASDSTLTLNLVPYATTPVPWSIATHNLLPRNSVQSLVDYYNGLDSGYESCGSVLVSPTSSLPLMSPTTSSSNDRLKILSDLFEPDGLDVRPHDIGRRHARCKVKCKTPEVRGGIEPSCNRARDMDVWDDKDAGSDW